MSDPFFGTQTINDAPVLLLTGFEPFGPNDVNPSWELAQLFDNQIIDGAQVRIGRLPVAWEHAWPALQSLIAQHNPTWILLLGLAEKRQWVSVEILAKNLTAQVADNRGQLPPAEHVSLAGATAIAGKIPAELLVQRFNDAAATAQISTDAGSYLCNWTYYHALDWAGERPEIKAVGFVHVPLLPEQGGPGITLDQLKQGLTLAIATLVIGQTPLAKQLTGVAEE